jgi:toxin ParE1/3/4
MTLLISPEAESDLLGIWHYIFQESNTQTADRLIESIIDGVFLVARHPFAGRLRNELRAGLRSFPIRSYVLFYRIDGENINILRVLHGQRDIETLFGS